MPSRRRGLRRSARTSPSPSSSSPSSSPPPGARPAERRGRRRRSRTSRSAPPTSRSLVDACSPPGACARGARCRLAGLLAAPAPSPPHPRLGAAERRRRAHRRGTARRALRADPRRGRVRGHAGAPRDAARGDRRLRAVAVAWAAIEFVAGGGGRQGSFIGEHDLAALGTLALVARARGRCIRGRGRPDAIAMVGIAGGRPRDRARRLTREPARALPRRGGPGGAGARAPLAPECALADARGRRGGDRDDADASQGELGFLQ